MIVKKLNTERLTGFTTGVTLLIDAYKRLRMTNPLAIYSEDIEQLTIIEKEGKNELQTVCNQWNSYFQQA